MTIVIDHAPATKRSQLTEREMTVFLMVGGRQRGQHATLANGWKYRWSHQTCLWTRYA